MRWFAGGAGAFRALALAICLIAALLAGGGPALAHTSLSGSSPDDGEVVTSPLTHLHLTFSGKLELAASLHTVTLKGPDGEQVPVDAPALDSGGKSLIVSLPGDLANGAYAVSFRVISADGHPISGGVAFELALPEPEPEPEPEPGTEPAQATPQPAATPDGAAPEEPAEDGKTGQADEGRGEDAAAGEGHAGHGDDAGAADGHEGHDHGGHSHAAESGSGALAALVFGSRMLYYAALLPLLGWALWSAFRPLAADRAAYWRRIGFRLQLFHLAAFVIHVALHWVELTGGGTASSFLDMMRMTGTGQSWLFTALLAVGGFPLLFRYRAVDGVWALLVIAAMTLRGHSSAFEPLLWSRLSDAVHLGAAALWVGGLLALVLLLRKSADWFRAFAPAFSTAALASFAVLAVSGVITVSLYTESLSDLLRTTWGWLLIAKVVLAAAVLPVAAMLRRRLSGAESRPDAFLSWLRADLALLAGVVALTGVLTHVSPIVERVPFHWHVMGKEAHLTVDMADVRSGSNELSAKIWVPEGDGAPAVSVVVSIPEGPESAAALRAADVPTEDWETFGGFDKYTFVGEVPIADPSRAEVRVRIQRSNGETLEYTKKLIDP